MRAQGNEGRLGRRFAIVIGVVAAGAAVISAGASADFRSVHDPRGDPACERGREGYGEKPCLNSAMRGTDIVRATAGHDGTLLKHTIRVVGKFQSGWLGISTDSEDERCEWSLALGRPTAPRQGAAAARGLSFTVTRSRSPSARVRSETPTATAGTSRWRFWGPRTGA